MTPEERVKAQFAQHEKQFKNLEWVGLTQKDVDDLLSNMSLGCVDDDVRLVEARLMEKNI